MPLRNSAASGTVCVKVETTFTRDDVWIYISMTNIDAAPLLPDIVATAWAA